MKRVKLKAVVARCHMQKSEMNWADPVEPSPVFYNDSVNIKIKKTFPDLAALGKQLNPAIDTLFMQRNLIPINP